MDTELQTFLLQLGVWIAAGAGIGLAVRSLRPAWARRWQKFCLNRRWKLFGLAALFFGTGAIVQWIDGSIHYAVLSGLLCLLEIVALWRYGFRSLTPEMEQRIDAS